MTSSPAAPVGRAARRWRRLVRARLAEMERLRPDGGAVGSQYWDCRARRFADRTAGTASGDPLATRLRRAATTKRSLLDVGAGSGRFSLALAPRVADVVAVDASAVMLSLLRRQARRSGLTNITTVVGRWEDVDVAPADLVLCAYVLPLIEDAAGFLSKLDSACRGDAFVYLSAMSTDAFFDPFWRHFHGVSRRPGPTFLDAVAILAELDIKTDVEIVELQVRSRFPNVAAAARDYRDNLFLPDTPEVRAELRSMLRTWLVRDGDALRPPLRTTPAAILHWCGGRRPSRTRRRSSR